MDWLRKWRAECLEKGAVREFTEDVKCHVSRDDFIKKSSSSPTFSLWGSVYCICVLLFGLRDAPYLFSRLKGVVVRVLRRRGGYR